MKKTKRRLGLNKETIRHLTESQKKQVHGGAGTDTTCFTCATCFPCTLDCPQSADSQCLGSYCPACG